MNHHHPDYLIRTFNSCFEQSEQSILVGGFDEPIYLPDTETGGCHEIRFVKDYFASALHEVAHWCIAGKERRTQIDFGYWYAPDGRNEHQQSAFEAVEVKPQAIESIFSETCGYPFKVSTDNLSAIPENADADYWQKIQMQKDDFARRVESCRSELLKKGMPERAERFNQALMQQQWQACA